MSGQASKNKVSGEPPGTVLLGSVDKRCYLFLCQSSARMQVERENARLHGIQDPIDFIFEIDGTRYELTYQQLRALLGNFVEVDSLRRHIADLERRLNVKLTRSAVQSSETP